MSQPKEAFEIPLAEIILFDQGDVITTSGGPTDPDDGNWGEWD